MTRRSPLLAAAAAAAFAIAMPVTAQKAQQSIGKGEGQVDIVAWAGYIERGSTDKNFDLVTASGDASSRLIRGKKLQPTTST